MALFHMNPEYALDPGDQTQAYEFAMSRSNGGAALWADPGMGKSVISTRCLVDWLNTPGLRKALITCPAGLTEDWRWKLRAYANIDASVWDEDPQHISCVQIISHTLLQQIKSTKVNRRNRVTELIAWNPDIVIADEGHKFKSYGASQTKGLLKLVGKVNPYKRLELTGTPTTTIDPEEIRPQLLFVDRPLLQRYGVDDWMTWRRKFCKITKECYGGVSVDRVVGCQNQALLDSILQQVALRQLADNLPEQVFDQTYFNMSTKAQRMYKKMAREGALRSSDLEVITSNSLDRHIRLSQIRSGFVSDWEGKDHILDDTAIDTALEMVSNTPLPLLMVYRFTRTGERLEEALLRRKLRVGHIRGGVTPVQKSAIEQRFQAGGLDVVLGQWAAISLGLTFTRGNHVIFAEPTFSLEEWLQTIGRIRRRGQTKTCFYHRLVESSSKDWENYDSLDNKEDFQEKITRNLVSLAA